MMCARRLTTAALWLFSEGINQKGASETIGHSSHNRVAVNRMDPENRMVWSPDEEVMEKIGKFS